MWRLGQEMHLLSLKQVKIYHKALAHLRVGAGLRMLAWWKVISIRGQGWAVEVDFLRNFYLLIILIFLSLLVDCEVVPMGQGQSLLEGRNYGP